MTTVQLPEMNGSSRPAGAGFPGFTRHTPSQRARADVDAWCILDPEHNLLMWNDGAADFLGRPLGSLAGLNVGHLLTPSQGQELERAVAHVIKHGNSALDLLLDLLGAHGTAVPVDAQVSALRDGNGTRVMVRLRRPGGGREEVSRVDTACRRWSLTDKQADVLHLVARGLSNKAAAERLHCAESTVELHMTAIFKKSGTKGRSLLLTHLFNLD
jgi:DNA-binding CsgD family transcriptional regulator